MRYFAVGAIATAIAIGALTIGGGGGGPSTYVCTGLSYFVDFAGGSDSNNGTSTSTPWKRAPGMVGFTGSYTHHVHDCFYFKGGVTWTGTFPLTPAAGGDGTANDYFGPKGDWFAGGSWTQPKFDAQGANIGGTTGVNAFFDLRSADDFTIDNFHLANYTGSSWAGTFGTCAAVEMQGDQAVTIENLLVDNFNIDMTSDSNGCKLVEGAGFGTYSGASVVKNSTFAGPNGGTAGGGIYCLGNVQNVVMHDTTGMIFPCGHGIISGNLLYNCGYPSFPAGATNFHGDAIQVDLADGTFYIHDNVIHDTGSDGSGNECESSLLGNAGETDYYWNNVLYNIHGNALAFTQNATAGNAYFVWNNTIVGGQDGAGYCVRDGHAGHTWPVGKVQNNHCISSASQVIDPALITDTTTLTNTNNVLQTVAAANGQGYNASQTYAFSPTGSGNATVDAGTDLSANCSGTLATLCSDTTYGGARAVVARPQRGGWDSGAYELP